MRKVLFSCLIALGVLALRASSVQAVANCPVTQPCGQCPANGCSGSAPGPNCTCKVSRSCQCDGWCYNVVGSICTNYRPSCSYNWSCPPPPKPTSTPGGSTSTPKPPKPTRPTSPPGPTKTPRPTPTPGICNCHGMDVTGVASPGETLTITAHVNVLERGIGSRQVSAMTFFVKRNGVSVAQSGPIVPGKPLRTVDRQTGAIIDRYSAVYHYTIPAMGAGGVEEYTIDVGHSCSPISSVIGKSVAGIQMQISPPPLITSFSPAGAPGLKLGTWLNKKSSKIEKSCDQIRFVIEPF